MTKRENDPHTAYINKTPLINNARKTEGGYTLTFISTPDRLTFDVPLAQDSLTAKGETSQISATQNKDLALPAGVVYMNLKAATPELLHQHMLALQRAKMKRLRGR